MAAETTGGTLAGEGVQEMIDLWRSCVQEVTSRDLRGIAVQLWFGHEGDAAVLQREMSVAMIPPLEADCDELVVTSLPHFRALVDAWGYQPGIDLGPAIDAAGDPASRADDPWFAIMDRVDAVQQEWRVDE